MEKITPYIDGFVNEILDFKNLTPAEQVIDIHGKSCTLKLEGFSI